MSASRRGLLHGTLDTLILRTVAENPRHGYAIAKWIEEESSGAIQVEEGSLYPALYRMEKRGVLQSEWGESEHGRRAKFYRITTSGRQQLEAETRTWERFATAVSTILKPMEEPGS